MEDLGFLFKDPEPLIFLTMSLWSSKSMFFFFFFFFFFIKPHASQPGCLGWWMSFVFANVNVLSITFWWLPEDLQSKRHSSSERLIFLFRTMTNKDNLSSLFNRNFLKYVPNSIYKYQQKRKFNIMIKLEISFSVRTSLSCLRFFSIVIAAYISHCSFKTNLLTPNFCHSFWKYMCSK